MQGQLSVTDEVSLRLLEEADAQELYALIEANRAQLARWREASPSKVVIPVPRPRPGN